jgi:hypothetical protein
MPPTRVTIVLGAMLTVAVAATGCTDGEDRTGVAPTTETTLDTTLPDTALPDTALPDTGISTTTSTTISTPTTPAARLDIDDDLDATALASRLSAAHTEIVDASAAPDVRVRAGIDYQLVLRELADRPDLDEAVLGALDPSARPTVEPIVRARQFLQQRSASRPPQPLPDEVPAWTIVEPEPVATLLAHYAEAERLTGIAWYWLAAIHLQETRMGRIQGVSTAGAVGPMQFLPTTWAACCTGDPTVTRDAIIGAATYLSQSGGPDDMGAAVYQYNPNDGYVAVVTAYAESLRVEPELYTGYHAFQVFFATSAGTVRLPVGYSQASPVDVVAYLASNPQDAA